MSRERSKCGDEINGGGFHTWMGNPPNGAPCSCGKVRMVYETCPHCHQPWKHSERVESEARP